jgi:hypothetical protein
LKNRSKQTTWWPLGEFFSSSKDEDGQKYEYKLCDVKLT